MNDAQRTPPRIGRIVYEETTRNTPMRDRVGPTFSERRTAQKNLPAKDRVGTHPPAYERPGTSRSPVARETNRKRKSRSARNSADYKGQKSIPRRAKATVQYREQDADKLDGQLGGCYFPTRDDTTTTDLDTESDSEPSEPRK